MSALQITVDERNDATVIVLDGEIDIATENDFRDAVTSAWNSAPAVVSCWTVPVSHSSTPAAFAYWCRATRPHRSTDANCGSRLRLSGSRKSCG